MKICTQYLRVVELALLANLAWFATSLSTAWALTALTLVLVAGFAVAFWEYRFYLIAAAVCAAVIVIDGLVTAQRFDAVAHGLSSGLFAFLAVAAPTLVIAVMLVLVAEVQYVSAAEDRYQARYRHGGEGIGFWISAGSGAYGVPIGIACGLVVGFAVGGWAGLLLALLVGSVAGALAAKIGVGAAIWQVGRLPGPVQPTNREQFLSHARQVPGELLTITITTVVLEGNEVRQFALTSSLEVGVMLLATGGLAVLLPTVMAALPFRREGVLVGSVRILLIGLGAPLGIVLGWLAGAQMLRGVAGPSGQNLLWVMGIAAAAAIVAVGLGRLGVAVGLAIGATLGILAGHGTKCDVLCGMSTGYRTLALAGIGLLAGAIVFTVIAFVTGIRGSSEGAFRPTAVILLFGGMLAAIVLGAMRGIGAF
jgi:hypothetical protein